MKSEDFDLICSALAFTAVAMTSDSLTTDGAQRAAGLAYLIKEFCRASVPHAFADMETAIEKPFSSPEVEKKFELVNRMATAIAQIMRTAHDCVPQDLIEFGFPTEDVNRHWAMAKALAHVELNMMDS